MPQVKIQKQGKESGWALWFITESEEELCSASGSRCPEEIINHQKRLEWLAGRALMKTLVEFNGLSYLGIHKDEYGKPFLNELPHQISLSHSFPYVAGQINPAHAVGVDVEQPKEKLLKIAHRIMNAEELNDAGTNITKHCIYWCAKETLYKIYGKRGLSFNEHLNLKPFVLENSGTLQGIIRENGTARAINLAYSVQADYVLVYTQTD
jgi:phosphopantetheinyl transferase